MVKTTRDTSELWAAQYRRNLLSHRILPEAPFFLIATYERMYFWRQGTPVPDDAPPQSTMDATVALKPYFDRFQQIPEEVSQEGLEWIVLSWLEDIASPGYHKSKTDPSVRWLFESGLIEALDDARVESSAVQ